MSKRKHEEHEEHVNHEAWVIPYADMLTLLMVMFLALFAMGNIDLEKFRQLASAFSNEMGGGAPAKVVDSGVNSESSGGGDGALEGSTPWPVSQIIGSITGRDERLAGLAALEREQAEQAAAAAEQAQLESVRATLEEHTASLGLSSEVTVRHDERGLVVTLVTDDVLFAPGSAALQQEGFGILDGLAGALQSLDNRVLIEGHTDSRPINTAQFPSNWELSTARATSVLRYLVDSRGLPASRVSAAGYADQRPIDTNDTAEGRSRNRRVEIVILANQPATTAGEQHG